MAGGHTEYGSPRRVQAAPGERRSRRRPPRENRSRLAAVLVLVATVVAVAITGVGVNTAALGSSDGSEATPFRLLDFPHSSSASVLSVDMPLFAKSVSLR